jgi:hypothetical protein
MGKTGNRGLWLTLLGLWVSAAVASPPVSQKPLLHLDLRPSASALSTEKTFSAFPSLHRQPAAALEQPELPSLGTAGARARIPGRLEEFARRVHREGLPVARLWENNSALVSLGLNQKG